MEPHFRVRKLFESRNRLYAHLAALSLLLLLALPSSAHADTVRLTVITDSVGASLQWEPGARAILAKGIDLDVEPLTCRKLVKPACQNGGPSALDTIQQLGASIGQLVVIDTGYNDTTAELEEAIDPIMRALVDRGVQHVIWLDYVERLQLWANHNVALVAASHRWPQMQIADWNAVALPHDDWFQDEAHMTQAGAQMLARFLHVFVQYDCGASCAPSPAYCGLARTVNGFDYVRATGIECPAALGSVVSFERGVHDGWVCSRNVDAVVAMTCVKGEQKIETLERSPVPATRAGGVVTLSNWSFRLRGGELQGREGTKAWRSLGRAPWCAPDVPGEVLAALGLQSRVDCHVITA